MKDPAAVGGATTLTHFTHVEFIISTATRCIHSVGLQDMEWVCFLSVEWLRSLNLCLKAIQHMRFQIMETLKILPKKRARLKQTKDEEDHEP